MKRRAFLHRIAGALGLTAAAGVLVERAPVPYVRLRKTVLPIEWTPEAYARMQRIKNAELQDLTEIMAEEWERLLPHVRRELEKPSPMLEVFPA